MENCFILLELPFDPPVEDPQRINSAIARKQEQWSRDKLNPVRKEKASEYLAHLEDIRKIMLDPADRKKEAAKARTLKGEKRAELLAKLSLYSAKGSTLSDRDMKQLLRFYGPFGFTEEEIREAFKKVGKGGRQEFDPTAVLDKTLANNVRNFMKQMDMKDQTLYGFLSQPPTASCAQLCEAANAKKKKILAKGEKTGKDNAAQSLCGLCTVIFKDTASKRKYDNYLNLTRHEGINGAVDEMAMGNRRKIEPRMKEAIIDIAVRQYGLSVPDASIYINNYCTYMGYLLPENKIICGLCGAENGAGSANCIKCGKPLSIVCPSCGAENNNSAKQCARCGFDLTGMEKAAALLKQARMEYAARNFDQAEKLLREAKGLWPGHGDIPKLEAQIAGDRKRNFETISRIMEDIQARRFYAARTRIQQARNEGCIVDSAVTSQVDAVLKEVDVRLSSLRSLKGDAAFKAAMKLRELISDCREVNDRLRSLPPEPSPGISVSLSGTEAALSWRPSPAIGGIQYCLVRKENSFPNSVEDGAKLYQGTELSWTDRGLRENQVYCYAVYVLRAEGVSTAAKLAEPVAAIRCPSHVRVTAGDQSAALAWDYDPAVTQVRVRKYCGLDQPRSDQAYEEVPCSRPDGLVVRDLANGKNYWFAVSAAYTIQGRLYYSEKVCLSVTPQKPPKPLRGFSARFNGELCQASWEPSECDLILFCSIQRPDYTPGDTLSVADLMEQYRRLDYQLTGPSSCTFQLHQAGECYVIPGVVYASNVVLSPAVNLSSVPPVKDISFDLNASGTELYVNYTWPRKINHTLLLYRMDRYPDGPEDPDAVRIEYTKRRYDANQGVLISNPAKGSYYAAVFTFLESDGRRFFSDGIRARFSNEPQREVFYTLQYRKPGFLNKSCTLSLTVEVPDACVFPAFSIVSKLRGVPLNRTDGTLVCSVSQETEMQRTRRFDFTLPAALKPGTKLKLFFQNDKSYRAFRVICKSGSSV